MSTPRGPAHLQKLIRNAATINATQKGMLQAAVFWMNWESLKFFPAIKTWAKAAGLSHQTIITHVRKLQALGVLEIEERFERGRSRTNVYRLVPSALQSAEPLLFQEPVTCDLEKVKSAETKGQTGALKRSNWQREKVNVVDPICIELSEEHPQHQSRPLAATKAVASKPVTGGGGGSNLSPDEIDAIVEAIEHLGVCTATAFELSHLDGMSMTKVRYVADRLNTACATGRIVYPAKLAEKFLRTGEEHLDGYKAWVREDNRRLAARARAQTPTQDSPAPTSPAVAEAFRALLVRRAERFAGSHADHAAFGAFCRSASRAIEGNRSLATGTVITTEIEQLQSPHLELRVLSLMAAAAGVSLEVPTDTLRIDRGEQAQGPQNVAL